MHFILLYLIENCMVYMFINYFEKKLNSGFELTFYN